MKQEGRLHDTAGSTIGWSGRGACVCLGGSAGRKKGGSPPVGQGKSQRGKKTWEDGGRQGRKGLWWVGAVPGAYQCLMLGLPGCADCAVDILAVVRCGTRAF